MLVKLPKEVGKIMATLQNAGFEVYVTGPCVAESMAGKKPFGWDLSTNADLDDMVKLFPEAEVFSEKYKVLRFEFIEEIKDKDGVVEGEEGLVVDLAAYRAAQNPQERLADPNFAATIEEDLGRRDFTMNAIADGQSEIVDPFGGKEDIRKRLVRSVGDANAAFKQDPIRMLRAIRLAADFDFDLHKGVHDAIVSNKELLANANINKIRDEFTAILASPVCASKGLSMLLDMGLLPAIIGENVVKRLTKREMQDLTVLSQKIDRTKPVENRRLGLFFTCIDKKKIRPSIKRLNFDEVTEEHLLDAVADMPKLYFTATKPALKKFIYERGWERYEYLANMEKAQRLVFDYFSETKIRSKIYLLEEIRNFNEPIFPEDLKIDANDLIEAGICTKENAEKVLRQVTEELHTHPKKNTREQLLKLAKVYSKNKVAAALRGIHWSR